MKKLFKLFKKMICPNCQATMSQGASHTGQGLQWECHNCGKIINH